MFRTYKNQELKKIFEPKRYELKWGWRKRLWGALTCCSRPKSIPQFVTTVTSGNTGMMMVTFAMESPTDNNFLTHTYKSYKKRSTWLWAPSVAMHNPIYIPPFATFWLQTWSFTQTPPLPIKSKGVRTGEREGQANGPPLPLNRHGKFRFNQSRAVWANKRVPNPTEL